VEAPITSQENRQLVYVAQNYSQKGNVPSSSTMYRLTELTHTPFVPTTVS